MEKLVVLAKGYASNQTNNAMENIMIVIVEPLDVIYVCSGKLDFGKRRRMCIINSIELLTAQEYVQIRKKLELHEYYLNKCKHVFCNKTESKTRKNIKRKKTLKCLIKQQKTRHNEANINNIQIKTIDQKQTHRIRIKNIKYLHIYEYKKLN